MRQVQMAVLLGTALLAGSSFARTVDVPEGTTETLSDSLSGGEELVKTGLGTLVLGGANTGWTGAIDVQGGVLESPYDSLGTTGDMRVRSGVSTSAARARRMRAAQSSPPSRRPTTTGCLPT